VWNRAEASIRRRDQAKAPGRERDSGEDGKFDSERVRLEARRSRSRDVRDFGHRKIAATDRVQRRKNGRSGWAASGWSRRPDQASPKN